MGPRLNLALSVLTTVAQNLRNEKTDEKTNAKLPIASDSRLVIKHRAREGTHAFSTVSIGEARIEGTFNKIAYCNFKGKPVCLIVMDLDFEYHEGCQFKDAQISLNIESESQSDGINEKAEDGVESVSSPKTVLQFGPRDHFGAIKATNFHASQEFNGGHVGNQFATGPEIKIGRRKTIVQECRWQIHGRADRTPRGQTYTWSAYGNKAACKDFASDKTFPRKVSIWMIVEHENQRFHADIEVSGRRRGDRRPWFGSKQRAIDRKVFEPISSTKSLDIVKLSQILDARNGAADPLTSELNLESCVV